MSGVKGNGRASVRPNHPEDPWATLLGFLRDRASWLRVDVAENAWGTYDVVLRVDGSYASERDARGVLLVFRAELVRLAAQEELELEDWFLQPPAKRRAKRRRGAA